jgi:zinc protease
VLVGGMAIPMSDRSGDYASMLVAERILGGATESRMFSVVRQQMGLSYGVGTFLEDGRLDDNSTLGLYAIYAPQNVEKVRAAIGEQVALAIDKGFTAEEVDNAKRALLEERRATRAQDAAVAGSLVSQAYLGRTWAFSADLDRRSARSRSTARTPRCAST